MTALLSTCSLEARKVLLIVTVLLVSACSLLYLSQPPFVAVLISRTMDAVMALAPARPPSGRIVIVDIDDKSLTDYGQWPWPRALLARLLDAIAASGSACIGLDMVLAEPERAFPGSRSTIAASGSACIGLDMVLAEPERAFPGSRSLPGHGVSASASTAEGGSSQDRVLAETLTRGPFVLGYAFSFSKPGTTRRECNLHPPGVVLVDQEGWADSFFTAKGVTCNLKVFANAVTRSGFLNAAPDSDGVLRRIPMVVRYGKDLYPSLTLAMLLEYGKMSQMEIVRQPASGRVDLTTGGRSIPFDQLGCLIVRFCQETEVAPRVSAGDVLTGGLAPRELKDKVVLVGFTAAGIEPSYATSTGLFMPVEIQAQALENLLNGEHVIRTAAFLLWEVILASAIAGIGAWAVARLRLLPGAAVCVTLVAGSWLGPFVVFRSTGYLFSPLLPTVMVVMNYGVLNMVKGGLALAEKQRQLEAINASLEQRVTETVSELRTKDRILIQQGRQAAMGEMISNIAHQWRQPLNVLALIVQELRITYGSENFNRETLETSVGKAMELIRHMSQTIEDFRNYFKPDKEKAAFRASGIVAKTLALAEANLRSVEITTEVKVKQDPEIFGYPSQYAQVLLNLLLNCRDAFEAGAIERPRIIAIEIDEEDGRSVVTVTDNAGGIPEEILDKIFDPYFTTKGPDKGTGIGLYMAKTIIEKNMNGNLTVRNTGSGAAFRIQV